MNDGTNGAIRGDKSGLAFHGCLIVIWFSNQSVDFLIRGASGCKTVDLMHVGCLVGFLGRDKPNSCELPVKMWTLVGVRIDVKVSD